MKGSRIVLAVVFSIALCGMAIALTDEERVKMLDDKFIKGEISEKVYLELKTKYGGEKSTEKVVAKEGESQYLWVEAEATDGSAPRGYWYVQNILDASGGKAICYGGSGSCGSWYGIEILEKGTYNIWLRHGRTKRLTYKYTGCNFEVQIDEKKVGEVKSPNTPKSSQVHEFGETAAWSLAGQVDLEKDDYQLAVIWREGSASRELDVILLSSDPKYEPKGIEKPEGAIVKDKGAAKGNPEKLEFE